MTAEPRAAWAEYLPAPPDAAPEEAVAALLRSLPGAEFLPPPERVAAVNALAGTALPVGPNGTVERVLRDEVAALAANFWALAPAERRAAWADLERHGAHPDRLRELEPGLDVPAAPLPDPVAEELAALFRALFLLPPRERAIRRTTWLVDRAVDAEKWRAALAGVCRDAPGVPALDPQLWAALGADFDLGALTEGASAGPERVVLTARRGPKREPQLTRSLHNPAARRVETEDDIAFGKLYDRRRRVAFVAVLLVMGLVIVLAATVRAPPLSFPPGTAPAPDRMPPAPTKGTYAVDEVSQFQRYDRDVKGGAVRIPPERYREWVRDGRPPASAPGRAGPGP